MTNIDFDRRDVLKALTAVIIEKVLLRTGKPILEKVIHKLEKEYKCQILDCYDHPEYLESVLKSIFGDSYKTIVVQIKEELTDYLDDVGINTLVKTICR